MTKSSLVAVATQPIFKSGVWLGKIHILRNHFESKTSKNVQKRQKVSKIVLNYSEMSKGKFMKSLFEPKTEQKYFSISALAS